MKINLTTEPEVIQLDSMQLLYIEKLGPFMKTAPVAWQEFWQICGPITKSLSISKMVGLSRIDESKNDDSKFVYQAGVFLSSTPSDVPAKLKLRATLPGKYARFLLTGPYHQLAEAYPQAFGIIASHKLKIRNEFCAEIYLNTPVDTEEKNLKTEILIPIH